MTRETPQNLRFLEIKFRVGACHAVHWLNEQARELATEGKSAETIADHLSDLEQVLTDWREFHTETDWGNPWQWPKKVLTSYISEHRSKW